MRVHAIIIRVMDRKKSGQLYAVMRMVQADALPSIVMQLFTSL